MPTKDELVAEAKAAGVDNPEHLTKRELERELGSLGSLAPPALGPVIPEGHEPPVPESTGEPIRGVQPLEPSDIPKAGR